MGRAAAVPLETDLREAAEERYLSYAVSVITSRARPDARDGLKPVQRRILYAMYQNLRLTAGARPRKSAAIVGEVLGKYHPHGDQAAYEAMVRMAQPFALRYPLVHGEGNFGSLDGDAAAAYRYTEARLTPLAEEMLADLAAETVPLRATFDAMLEEPTVLPSAIPQLLMNGWSGTSGRRSWRGSSPRCSTCATSRPPTCASSSSSRPTRRPRPRWPTSTSTPRCRRTSTST